MARTYERPRCVWIFPPSGGAPGTGLNAWLWPIADNGKSMERWSALRCMCSYPMRDAATRGGVHDRARDQSGRVDAEHDPPACHRQAEIHQGVAHDGDEMRNRIELRQRHQASA